MIDDPMERQWVESRIAAGDVRSLHLRYQELAAATRQALRDVDAAERERDRLEAAAETNEVPI